jgi:hypothetical protein
MGAELNRNLAYGVAYKSPPVLTSWLSGRAKTGIKEPMRGIK